uniref:Gustatory receptor n=1 Tax=Cacopsylla melanoneura TaxID=428564 RepID=A0A8D9F948_9HEMI
MVQLHKLDKKVHEIRNITVLYISNIIQLGIIATYPILYFFTDLHFSSLFRQIFNDLNENLDVRSHKKSSINAVRNIFILYYIVVFTGQFLRWHYFGRVFGFALVVSCVIVAYGYVFQTYAMYITIICIIKNELRSVNKKIKEYLNHGQYHLVTKEDIYRLDKKYNTLYNISMKLNEKYSILIASVFFMDTAGIASGIFKVSQNFIETYIAQAATKISPILIHELEWWCHHLCFFLWVIHTSVSTQQKAHKTALLAHKLHLHNTNPELTAATGTFRRHLKLQEMKFTGSDMFDVNYETMLSVSILVHWIRHV